MFLKIALKNVCVYIYSYFYLFIWLHSGFSLHHSGSLAVAHRLSSCGMGSRACRLGWACLVGHGLSCSEVCGILVPDQGLTPSPLHCYANSQPLDHQGSPSLQFWGHFWLCWVFADCTGFSLVAVSWGQCLVSVHGLLIAVASLVVEPGLEGLRASVVAAPRLWSTG